MENTPNNSEVSPEKISENTIRRFGAEAIYMARLEEGDQKESPEKKQAENFLKRHGKLFSLFAKDSSLNFKPSEDANTFAFNAKKLEVQVPLNWFASEKYNENELQFANYHELAHFIDMRKNPEAYLANFERMQEKSNELARAYCRKHKPEASLDAVKEFYHKELHTLYNCLDDIYVNNLVTQRNHYFDYGDGKGSIETLYEKLNFKEPDLTEQPLHRQMVFALLRDEMVGRTFGKSQVSSEVQERLSKKILGQSLRERVNNELKPKQGILADPAERYEKIRAYIEPKYLELLEMALEQNQNKDKQDQNKEEQNQSGQNRDGQGGPQSKQTSNFDPFNDESKSQSPEFFDDGEPRDEIIKEILGSLREEAEKEKMSPEERAKYDAGKRRKEFDEEHGITEKMREEAEGLKSEIEVARKEMRKFWRRLIGKSIEYRMKKVDHQRRGHLNVNDYIKKYPEVIEAERKGELRNLEVYSRNELEHVVINQPETIDISLLIDCSGSMSDVGKIQAAKRTAALLMYSIRDFNEEIEMTRNQTHSKLRANTEVIAFGDDYDEIKSFERNNKNSFNDANIVKSLPQINSNRGGTDDATPLNAILNNISTEEKDRIKSKKLKKIVFEITDGVPNDPEETATCIKRLSDEGVLTIGFQIGNVNNWEQKTFEEIWNKNTNINKYGIYVGNDINSLPKSLMTALSGALQNIII